MPYQAHMRSELGRFFVRGARNGHFFFQRGYVEYHVDRFQDTYLVVVSSNRMVAGVLATNVKWRYSC